MEIILSVAIAGLMGYWCYTIAQKNGRSEVLAGFMGFLFGICAVLVYYILGKTDDTKRKEIEDIVKDIK